MAAGEWYLVVLGPASAGKTFPLSARTTIGRYGNVAIKLNDPRVSRQHALLEIQGSACRLTDLESSNGTSVNGRRIEGPVRLEAGDTIKVGDTFLKLQRAPG